MDSKLKSTDRPVKISYVYISDVTSYTEIGGYQCSVQLTGEWKEINTTIGSIKVEEKTATNNGGEYFETTIQAILPGHELTTPGNMQEVAGRKVLIKVDYKSGLIKIIGNKTYSPKFFISKNSSTTTYREIELRFKSTKTNKFLVVD
jgi:hypothetical protein